MAKSNSGPMENLYRSVRRDVERGRAGRSRSASKPQAARASSKPQAARASSKPRAARASSKPRAARASSKPRAARAPSKPRSSSSRDGLSSRTPAQRAAFQRMIAARGNGPSRPAGRRDPRAGRDDNLQARYSPSERGRINVNEPWERKHWSRALGVSVQTLVDTVRRLGGTPTVERVRNALLGRDRARPAHRGTSRGTSRARSAPRGRTGARGGRPLGRDTGYVLR